MLPSLLARDIQTGVKQFLVTAFEPSDSFFHGLVQRFVDDEPRWMKGPFLQLGLPFRDGEAGTGAFGGFAIRFPGWVHQEQAWARLRSDRGKANTLVATGTGSGKTECFLYPVLDHCARARASGEQGIKALVIYPMNALATDQARRFAGEVARVPAFKGLRVGLYVGGRGERGNASGEAMVMTPTRVITDRNTLRKHPPDVLLTNYKMLDYLLVRPKDRALWVRNGPATLRYVVVDELHTVLIRLSPKGANKASYRPTPAWRNAFCGGTSPLVRTGKSHGTSSKPLAGRQVGPHHRGRKPDKHAMQSRAGRTLAQATGYLAYVPAPLPPTPAVELDAEAIALLSRADQALGKLDGVTTMLPNPDPFVGMYVRKEALLSSQIEGIDSTLDEVIRFEQGQEPSEGKRLRDTAEVVNYVRALKFGIRRLAELPLCLRLIREIHAELLHGVRGDAKAPGEFRATQNWIGPQGASLAIATFVPPPVPEMTEALDNFEKFLHERQEHPERAPYPIAIECALVHAQFETIHPFLDGNGRLGRLLIALLLHERRVLSQPLLYLSLYLKGNRLEYYDRLTAVRKHGDWEGWTKFFLKGVEQTALQAVETAKKVIAFRDNALREASALGSTESKLVEFLFGHPLTDIQTAQKRLGVSYNTAAAAIGRLQRANLMTETTGRLRNRVFRFAGFLDLFGEAPAGPAGLSA